MQRWDGEDGMAALNMQRWDGEVSQSRAQSALNKHNDAIWLPKHYLSQHKGKKRERWGEKRD